MKTYALYVESGPKMRKTQVHVIDLLGCVANGATTEEALERTPHEIRAFLKLAKKHGENFDAVAKFETKTAMHEMKGTWIGQGDPDPGFPSDFEPLTSTDEKKYIARLDWMQDDFVRMIAAVTAAQLTTKPAQGRAIREIARHVAGAHHAYMQTPVARPKEAAKARRAVEESADTVDALREFFALMRTRLKAITPAERKELVPHGLKTWTARRMFRRMLEHQWEHLRELSERVAG